MIPYGKQSITEEDIKSVEKVLRSDFLTQGPLVPLFEKRISEYTGVKYTTAVNSATSALHIAYLALDIKKNDIVWTSPITFVATSNAALMCGAIVDFVDIEENTLNMSVSELEKKLIDAKEINKLPKLVAPVHMCGQSCDMEQIYNLSKKYGFKIVEDASHAIGGSYQNLKVGSCKYSDITVLSFHPVKIITTGEGGAVLTNSKELDDKVKLLRTHGIVRENLTRDEGPWYYEQHELGYNYRMTELQAALGVSQLDRIDDFVARRNEIANYYVQKLDEAKIPYVRVKEDRYSSYHLFVIKVDSNKRRKIFEEMRSIGLGVQVHYFPVHKQPYYKKMKDWTLPASEKTYQEIISIPIFYTLSNEDASFVIDAIKRLW